MNIVLTGFMGTGKSTVGRLLSRELGLRFMDLDELIEREAALEVKDIFEVHGEARFRELESSVIERLSSGAYGNGIIISTGGGAVLNGMNRTLLRSFGKVVCLRASVDEILKRVGERTDRPLLARPDKETIERLLKERDNAYGDSDIAIDTTALSIEQVVKRVVAFIETSAKTPS